MHLPTYLLVINKHIIPSGIDKSSTLSNSI